MPWTVKAEHPEHFEVEGNAGAPFRIRKANLSPTTVERMRLACGGEVKPKPSPAAKQPKQALAEGGPVDAPIVPAVPPLSPGLGTLEVGAVPPPVPQDPAFVAPLEREQQLAAVGGLPALVGTGAERPSVVQEQIAAVAQPSQPAAAPAPAAAGTPDAAAWAAAAQAGAPGGARPPQLPTLPAMPPAADWNKLQGQVDLSLREGKGGAEALAKAEAQKADAMAGFYQKHLDSMKALEDRRVQETQAAQTSIDKLIGDIQGSKIEPDRFWSSKSTGQKIATALGMVLSGLGSGLSRQPNMAAEFLNKQIDRDIEAQKADLGRKETLLGFMFKKYGNIQDASTAAKSYLLATLAGQTSLVGARAGSQEAAARADMLKAQLTHGALAAQAQIIQGRHQDAMQRYSMDLQRQMLQMVAGQGGAPEGYLPSRAAPPAGTDPMNPLKNIVETRKDASERTLIGPGGKPFIAFDKETAHKTRPLLQAADAADKIVKDMEELRGKGLVPGSKAANQYEKFWHSLSEKWAMANGLTQPSEVSNRNLEAVMPSKWEAFVRGDFTFDAIRKLLHDHRSGLYEMAGLHPSALPVMARPHRAGGR